MPSYAVPSDLDKFLKKRVLQADHMSEIKALLEGYLKEGAYPKKKDFDGRVVYTLACDVRDGSRHRFIFEQVNYNGQSCFLLRDLAWQHDYDKALRWRSSSPSLEGYRIIS